MFCIFVFLHLALPLSFAQPLLLKKKILFLGEMSVRNGFKKERLVRRDDSTSL